MAKATRLLSKVGGNVIDQALAALSNFVLAVLVARSLDAAGFGSFSIAFLIYGMAFAAMKSLVGQPLQIRFSGSAPDELKRRMRDGAGATVVMSVVAALGCAAAGWWVGGPTGAALLSLAVWLPSLLTQDFCRMAFFAANRPWSAALIDVIWAVVQFGCLALLITSGRTGLSWLMGAWGLGALCSAVAGLGILGIRPRLRVAAVWLREQATLSRYLLAEYALSLGAMHVAILVVGIIADESAVGSLRAAQVLLGPLGILGTAAFQFTVPEVARRTQSNRRSLRTLAGVVSGGLLTMHVVYVTGLLLMPAAWGIALFGDSWHGAALVLLPMCISACFSCMANGPAGVLYGMGRARETFRINVVKGPMILVLMLSATWLWGVLGSAWAFAVIETVILPFWVVTLVRASRRPMERGILHDPERI